MKKIKIILFTFLILFLGTSSLNAQVILKDRNESNNYGVNKKWNITDRNKNNVLKTPYVDASEKIYDFSLVLTEEEKEILKKKIIDFKEKTGMELIILIDSLPYYIDSQNEDYASDFYDYNDFGIGMENYDGILLFRNTYSSDPYFDMYTFGNAQLYFNSKKYNDILDNIYNYLHNEYYLEGFEIFIDKCLQYVEQGIDSSYNNAYIDENGIIRYKFRIPYVFVSIVSIIGTSIVIGIFIHKNKMVKKAKEANDYLEKGSIVFKTREDRFVNSVTTSHTISSSSGGGGSHIGSSGGGHSSGGGRHG